MGSGDSKGVQWVTDNVSDLSGKVIVVTGCNSGIGAEAAKIFAGHGAHVIMANRSEARTKEAIANFAKLCPEIPQDRFEFMCLDLADLDSVTAFGSEILQKHPKIDALVCNAGVMATPLERTKQGHEMQFGTNMLGHYSLILKILPVLQANTPSARIVILSSMASDSPTKFDLSNLDCSKGYSAWGRYGETKLGDLLMMTHLTEVFSKEDNTKHITITACHPGYSATNLQNGTFFAHLNWTAQSAFMGSLPTVMAATDVSLASGAYIGPTGKLSGLPIPNIHNKAALDKAHAKEVCDAMDVILSKM